MGCWLSVPLAVRWRPSWLCCWTSCCRRRRLGARRRLLVRTASIGGACVHSLACVHEIEALTDCLWVWRKTPPLACSFHAKRTPGAGARDAASLFDGEGAFHSGHAM